MPTWRDFAQTIAAKNPNISPAVFFRAMDMATKSFLTPQAQLQYRLETIQIRELALAQRMAEFDRREERIKSEGEANRGSREDIATANRGSREDIASANRGVRTSEGEANRGVRVSEGEANRGVRVSEGEANRGSREGVATANRASRETIAAENITARKELQNERLTRGETNRAAALALRDPEVKAMTSALSRAQQQKVAVDSFSNSEIKNLDLLVQFAEKVDTTGVPAIERWLRAGKKAGGDKDVQAFIFQLNIVRPGIARIVSSPNLTGSLTNKARDEIEAGMGEGISAEQLRWIAPQIKRDVANRKDAIDDEVDRLNGEIRARLQAVAPGSPSAAAPATPARPRSPPVSGGSLGPGGATPGGGVIRYDEKGNPIEEGGSGARPFDQPPVPPAAPEEHTKHINPTMKAFREALTDYIMHASERTKTALTDIGHDPISLVGTSELGAAIPKGAIFDLLKQGKTISQIAEAASVSRQYISRLLRDAKLTNNPTGTTADTFRAGMVEVKGYPLARKGSVWADPDTNKKAVDLFNSGATIDDIAAELKVTRDVVAGRLRRMRKENEAVDALQEQYGPRGGVGGDRRSKPELDSYIRYRLQRGDTQAEIARELGVSRVSVNERKMRMQSESE
jgi:transcriptional regulator with XRE-family HTH domain